MGVHHLVGSVTGALMPCCFFAEDSVQSLTNLGKHKILLVVLIHKSVVHHLSEQYAFHYFDQSIKY